MEPGPPFRVIDGAGEGWFRGIDICEGAGDAVRLIGVIAPLKLGRPVDLGLVGNPTGAELGGGICGVPVRPGGNLF
jgi:hypothetical protein